MPAPAPDTDRVPSALEAPLAGVRICLVFEYSLLPSTRYRQEIQALQQAGASVQLLTSHSEPEELPSGLVKRTIVPRISPSRMQETIPDSKLGIGPLRALDDLARRVIRAVAYRLEDHGKARADALERIAREVDLFWVSDYLSLPAVMKATRGTPVRVLYETIDLVPEYTYHGERESRRMLRDERRLIGDVDGFVTACDSYADYYMDQYGDRELKRRPVVRSDMPAHIVDEIRATSRPLRVLFLGALMFDRPVAELIEAVRLAKADVTLTFQGPSHLGDEPARWIENSGLTDKVRIVPPCAHDEVVETASHYDVGIVALRGENENERRASTTKLFTYMSAGLAILGSNLPGIARVVTEHHNGLLVDGMQPAAWASAIDELAALSDEEIDSLKQRSLDAARGYAWEIQRPAFIAEFVRALGRS